MMPLARITERCFDALPDHLAVVDASGRIILVNEAWRRFAAANRLAMPDAGVGANYFDVCERAQGCCSGEARRVAQSLRGALAGCDEPASVTYPCFGPNTPRWCVAKMASFWIDSRPAAVIAHQDVTDLMMSTGEMVG